MGLSSGLVVGEALGLGVSGAGMEGRGIWRESLLLRALWEELLDFGRNFQPRGSCPVMIDVFTGGGEEQEEDEEEEEEERCETIPMGGQE